jgi:hypothetical protein
MDDTDEIWQLVRTWHIAKVLEYIPEQMKIFVTDNKAAQYELSGGGSGTSALEKIDGIKNAVNSMGQYQDLKAKYAKHTALCQRMMALYTSRNLEAVSQICQDNVMTVLDIC